MQLFFPVTQFCHYNLPTVNIYYVLYMYCTGLVHCNVCYRHFHAKPVHCLSHTENWSSNAWLWRYGTQVYCSIIWVMCIYNKYISTYCRTDVELTGSAAVLLILLITPPASCGTVYCNRSCLWVCGCICFWVCYPDNSKLRASILTKLGL